MKKLFVRLFLVLAGVAALGIPVKAQASEEIRVKIPFQFVAAGTTLPAGEYRITRLLDQDPRVLLLSSLDNHVAVMIRTDLQDALDHKANLSFATVGNQHFLTRIDSEDHVRTLAVPSAQILLAAAPKNGPVASDPSGKD